jgi:2C-methyl-D-erythritol 2,4-cyclodiphosphate synthase
VNLKVTSTDGLGATGAGEGMAAMAAVLLRDEAEER